MNRKLVLFVALIIFLSKVPDSTIKVQAKSNGAIYIRVNGLVDPPAPITTTDNVTYTFVDDVNGSIIVQRSNIIIDGKGHQLNGPGVGNGFYLDSISNVTIKRTMIQDFDFDGIHLYRTSDSKICENMISGNSNHGIYLGRSLNTTIVGNIVSTNKDYGIVLQWSLDNTVSGNNISGNLCGMFFDEGHRNTISRNIVTESVSHGMYLYLSFDNNITQNTIDSNKDHGLYLQRCHGITLSKNSITNNKDEGVNLDASFNNTVIRNNIAANKDEGIYLRYSERNQIYANNMTSNLAGGITLTTSSNGAIYGNTVSNNDHGIGIFDSYNNSIYHNNFVDNNYNWLCYVSANVWDNGFEGNYWSNYLGIDSNHDGIGDSYHAIDANNTDHYPLMGMFHSFNASLGYDVSVISNSTIEDFEYFMSNGTIRMRISSMTANQTFGFCRVCIPKDLMPSPYTVMIDDGLIEALYFNETIYVNSTHTWIYFAYADSTHEIAIIAHPNNYYLFLITATLFMAATLVAVIVYRRKRAHAYKRHFSV